MVGVARPKKLARVEVHANGLGDAGLVIYRFDGFRVFREVHTLLRKDGRLEIPPELVRGD